MAALDRGGVLLRYGEGGAKTALAFIPAEIAGRLTSLSPITAVPGTPDGVAGIALADSAVVLVLILGTGLPPPCAPEDGSGIPGADRALLCSLGGLCVALAGGRVLATGWFEGARDGGVHFRGHFVPLLDVRAMYARAEGAIWAERTTRVPRRTQSEAPAAAVCDETQPGRQVILPAAPLAPDEISRGCE